MQSHIHQIIQEEQSSCLKEISRQWAVSLTGTYRSFSICPSVVKINQGGTLWESMVLWVVKHRGVVGFLKGQFTQSTKHIFSHLLLRVSSKTVLVLFVSYLYLYWFFSRLLLLTQCNGSFEQFSTKEIKKKQDNSSQWSKQIVSEKHGAHFWPFKQKKSLILLHCFGVAASLVHPKV